MMPTTDEARWLEVIKILNIVKDTIREERETIGQLCATIHFMRERLTATQKDSLALAARLVKVEQQIAVLNKKLNVQTKKPTKARKQGKLTRK
jgi:hypothetical protein